MMVLYKKNETDFKHNGLAVLDDYVISPVVEETLNGIYKLEFDYPTNAQYGDEISPERIVKCPVPYPDVDDQLFRIAEREAAIGGIFHIVAYHVFYDLAQNLIEDTNILNKTGNQAIAQLLGSTQFAHPFTGSSNILTISTARMVRLNPAEAIIDSDTENTFISRWGGEIVRDNFHVAMQKIRGSNNGVQIRDKKNLTGYRANVDFSTVVTRIMPQGFDGLFLPEKYVDSPLINNYQTPRIRVIKYDSVKAAVGKAEDDEDALPLSEAYALLRTLAAKEFSENHIDVPSATYEIQFAPLERTEEYKEFSQLETINTGDVVSVIHEEDGLNISSRMIGYTYDPILQAYISVTLGNYEPKFTDVLKDIKRMDTLVRQTADDANYALLSANGKNTNYYGTAEPDNPRKGDLWFKENGDKIEIWIYETRGGVTQWYQLAGDIVLEEMRQELERAAEEAKEATQKAEDAQKAGEEALAAGQEAYQKGEEAKAAAEEATQAGADALAAGQAAYTTAEQAAIDAANALISANKAVQDADDAISSANSAKAAASDAFNKSIKSFVVSYAVSANGTNPPAAGWQPNVPTSGDVFLWTRTIFTLQDNSSTTAYSVSMRDFGNIDFDVQIITEVREQFYLSTSQTTPTGGSWSDTVPVWTNGKYYWTRIVATYDDGSESFSTPVLARALNQSLVTALNAQTLSQNLQTTVTQQATAISLNATNITKIADRVTTAEASLTVQAGQIALKASKTDLDTVIGRVLNAEASITTQAGLIQLKASQSSVDTLTGRVSTAEGKITQNATNINLRVSKNDVINQINISNESILIAGNKIHITGTTTIDDGIIKTAMIANAAINNAKIADLAVNTAKIANAAITSAKIGSLAVGTAHLQSAAITTAKIADAAITDAKIANLSASKITTGTLAAGRIAAGSITSDKLTIATGFIKTAMIANAAITNAKIANLDAAKITTGTLNANRIGANSITADKLSANAIQVGLAGWNSSIRISPTKIDWYTGSTKTGSISSDGMTFYYGTRLIGYIGQSGYAGNANIQGISMRIAPQGDYIAWTYQDTSAANPIIYLMFDPKNKTSLGNGIRFGTNLYLNGYKLYTSGNRALSIFDLTLSNGTTYPSIGASSNACLSFGSSVLYLITGGYNYSFSKIVAALQMLINRVGGAWMRPTKIDKDGTVSSWTVWGESNISTSLM